MSEKDCLCFETIAVHGSTGYDEQTGAVSFPIYQSATFRHNGLNQSTGFDYSRLQNPTRLELENTLAKLEGGSEAVAFSSGVAAITTVVNLFVPGDHLIVSNDLYGGTYRLFENIFKIYGLEFNFVDTTNIEEILENIKPNTKGIFIETPSNPMMKVTDIRKVVKIAKERNILTIVDNTFLTPFFQKPLELGADIVVHSGTKFLGGHNDTLSGFVVVKDKCLGERIRYFHKSTGATLAPFDCWLVLRGLKTLHLRLERQQENAIKIANFLKEQEAIEKVYYVGLPTHEGYEINKSQSSGFGAMISFTVKDVMLVEKILGGLKVIYFAESLGGVETLITYPHTQTHSEMPADIKERLGVNDRLLRLSVGVESVDDLINDLKGVLR